MLSAAQFKLKFESKFKLNSLVAATFANDVQNTLQQWTPHQSKMSPTLTNGLHMISPFYMYTNPPPHGYGTPGPKVAETVLRAYGYNLKTEDKSREIGGYQVENLAVLQEKDLDMGKVSGNYVPSHLRQMAENFLQRHFQDIRFSVQRTMEEFERANCDVLSAGRQTWDAEAQKSITCPKAFRRVIDLMQVNLGYTPISCLEFIEAVFSLMAKDRLIVKVRRVELKNRLVYVHKKQQRLLMTRKFIRIKNEVIEGSDAVYHHVVDLSRSFCSYIKHGERGKKDRRAIASPTIFLRMFLKVVENFHLDLGKAIPGSTISIGGDEKKAKILAEMTTASIDFQFETQVSLQATEDATKWNECLTPSAFGLCHHIFFSSETRNKLGLAPPTDHEKLFLRICNATFYLMSIKRIHMGAGLTLVLGDKFTRMDWEGTPIEALNRHNQDWMTKIQPLLHDGNYLNSSPGFLMGMFNAGSTTMGLLPVGYRKEACTAVSTIRSSDDSMSLFTVQEGNMLARCIERNRQSMKLIGINQSTSKTLFFPAGYGEYTSWFMDGSLVSSYGVETSSMKPGGKNSQEDFDSIARNVQTLMNNYTVNFLGAVIRLRIMLENVRRLWKIKPDQRRSNEGIKKEVVFLADGGKCPWTTETLSVHEATLRFDSCETEEDFRYMSIVMDPSNPFVNTTEDRVMFSKDQMQLVVSQNDNPTCIFNFLKRSNKTINNETSKIEVELEKQHREAVNIMDCIAPNLLIQAPNTKQSTQEYVLNSLRIQAEMVGGDPELKELVEAAIRHLKTPMNQRHGEADGDEYGGDNDDNFEDL